METSPSPYDIAEVKEGILSRVFVAQAIIGLGHRSDDRFGLLHLKQHLEKALENDGRPSIVKIKGETLEVLPPADGDHHMANEGHRALRLYASTHMRRLTRVQAHRLTDEQRAERDRGLALSALRLQAIGSAGKLSGNEEKKLVE